jgi:hypothetical protein
MYVKEPKSLQTVFTGKKKHRQNFQKNVVFNPEM